jgi:diguanylate cyclase (GGDEF)-like protein
MAHNLKKILSLNISRKILFGYLVLAAFTIALGIFSLSALNRINNINRSLVETDTQTINIAGLSLDALLDQERYGRRYVILKTPEMLNLFWERSVEFKQHASKLKELPPIESATVDEIVSRHSAYTEAFYTAFEALMKPGSRQANAREEDIKKRQGKIIEILDGIATKAHEDLDTKTHEVSRLGLNAFRIAVVLCSLALLTGISAAAMITRGISDSIDILKTATAQVASGDFDDIPIVKRNDELGDLSRAFGDMAIRIKHLEEMYLDASPLTHLPGGIAIENLLKKRIASEHPMAFALLDMDNFKAFNDYYGYAKGSELIVAVAHIIESTVNELGSDDDFVGHIGGDDFALITEPSYVSLLCKSIVERFDREVLEMYTPEDRERGYIIGETRQGDEAIFPIVTISIAVVTNQSREISNHLEIGEIAAELKEYAKSIGGSVFVVDHRRKTKRQE